MLKVLKATMQFVDANKCSPTQTQLGEIIGMTSQHVSRHAKRLRDEGFFVKANPNDKFRSIPTEKAYRFMNGPLYHPQEKGSV